MARRAVLRQLRALREGRLQIQDALGTSVLGDVAEQASIDVRVRISDLSAWLDIASGGTIGAAEAYMAGKWHSNDLLAAMRLLVSNRTVMDGLETGMARLGSTLLRLAHWQEKGARQAPSPCAVSGPRPGSPSPDSQWSTFTALKHQ